MSNDILVPRGQPPCPCEQIAEAYNAALSCELPKVLSLTEQRRKTLRARWREDKDRQNIAWWKQYFETVRLSDFLTGRCPPTQGRASPWTADFDWLIKPANMQKVVEGKYSNKPDVFEQAIAHGYTGFGGSLRDLVDVEAT